MRLRHFFLDILISLIAVLPFGILYVIADFLTLINIYVIKYRKSIIYRNLGNAFPDKSTKEIRVIAHQYYKNLSDLTIEILKSAKMTRSDIDERVIFKNKEIFDEYYASKKSVFVTLGHCGNWEWVGNKIATFLHHEGAAVYKPIHDKFFDDFMIRLRQKYKGTLMIDYKKVFRTLVSLKEKLLAVFVLADQSPPKTELNYFVDFLGQPTAFYDGMEKVARALDYTVIYLDIRRIKRGYYEVELIRITESAIQTPIGYITNKYANLLEQSIINQPDNWLWSHNRWKN